MDASKLETQSRAVTKRLDAGSLSKQQDLVLRSLAMLLQHAADVEVRERSKSSASEG